MGVIITTLPRAMIITISLSVLAVLLLAGFVLYMWISQERDAEKARIMKGITDSLGAGVVNFILNEEGHITSVSNGFYLLCGFTEQEVRGRFSGRFYEMIEPKYAELLRVRDFENGDEIQEEIELRTAKGLKWVLLNGRAVQRKGKILTMSAVLLDVDEKKKLNDQVALQQERYRLATELSNDVILNYSIADDTLTISENFRTYFGGATVIPGFMKDRVWEKGYIHKDDIEKVAELMRLISTKGSEIDEQIRVKNVADEFIWCRLICMSVKDAGGLDREYIGKLINIDLHKKELKQLEKKAMRDPLTGAINKEYTKTFINDYINEHPDDPGILFMVDIDHFKAINDNFGHLAGDYVIMEVVNQVKRAFRSGDIVGRIGGDEFVVFVCNVHNPEDQIKQAQKLHKVLGLPVTFEGKTIAKSASIGVAMYPQHGKSYDSLLNCADTALYRVKDNGRDAFEVYHE